uniref:Putative ParA family partition protein n=1 Tax=Rhodopseudomonas palustris (strain BisA53) TaxID=316055 RepID=Q07K12_RHOP5
MHTIVLATQKGGSGKSTLAIGLALAAMQAGHAVRLIETDPQGTLSNWQLRRPKPHPVVDAVHSLGEFEERLQIYQRAGMTMTIVDTAGGISAMTSGVIRHADLCLIPVRPSIADIEATASTLHDIRESSRPFAYVMNQTPYRGQRIAHAANALGEEAADHSDGLIAQPLIVMRNDHQDAMAAGLAVGEYSPVGKSADEIRALWHWIEARLGAGLAVPQEVQVDQHGALQSLPLYAPVAAGADAVGLE